MSAGDGWRQLWDFCGSGWDVAEESVTHAGIAFGAAGRPQPPPVGVDGRENRVALDVLLDLRQVDGCAEGRLDRL